jgi:O-antigen/teichoic acid export membrane protein
MAERHRAERQVASTAAAKVFAFAALVVNASLTARYLGPEGRGAFAAAVSWVSLFAVVGYLSLAQVVVYRAAGRPREAWLPGTVGTLLGIAGMVTLLGWAVAAAGYLLTGAALFNHLGPGVLALAFCMLPFLLWLENGNALLAALDALRVHNAALVLGAVSGMAAMGAFLVLLDGGVPGALLATLVYHAVVVLAGLAFVLRQAGPLRFSRDEARALLGGGARLHLNAIGTYAAAQANILILNHFRPLDETGYYHLATQLVNALQVVPAAFSMVAFTLAAAVGPDGAWPRHRVLLARAVGLVLAAAGVLYVLAPWVIRTVAGPEFAPAVTLFRVLLLSVGGMTFTTLLSSQWIMRGLFMQLAALSVGLGALNVTAAWLLVPRHGALATAWVAVGIQGVAVLVNGAFALWVERRLRRSVAPPSAAAEA